MNSPADKSPVPMPTIAVIAVIAVILLGIVGVVRIMGWIPNSIGGFANILAIEVLSAASAKAGAEPGEMDLPRESGDARGKRRCSECGVVVTMREIDASGPNVSHGTPGQQVVSDDKRMQETSDRRYEFTIRLEGGSRRVIIDSNAARWRPGERVIFIDGANPLHR